MTSVSSVTLLLVDKLTQIKSERSKIDIIQSDNNKQIKRLVTDLQTIERAKSNPQFISKRSLNKMNLKIKYKNKLINNLKTNNIDHVIKMKCLLNILTQEILDKLKI